jgi:apolipoprotein N-acyltransferase
MSWLLGGFPWNLLGASQHQIVPLIQLASLTGVYGVSFLVAWTSVCLLSAGAAVVSRPTTRGLWMAELLLPITAVAGAFVFGFYRLAESPAATRELRVTLVQPSIPQTLIWDASSNAARFQDLLRLTEQALTNRTDLLIWPESAIPNLLRYNLETFTAVTNLAAGHHVWMIVGSDDAMPAAHPRNPQDADYFNSSFLISPEGRLAGEYRKRNLVIFGEYIPLEHTIPFLKWFTPVQGSFTPGTRAAAFDLGDLDLRTSVLICYEDVFPQLGRQCSDLDADFLVNITNDGWFGDSAAQWQHADSALFRAVENGVPLIRCTNNGLTCWFDAYGRLGGLFTDSHETVYGPGFMTVTVPLPSRADRAPTLYDRGGYWFGWACAAFTALVAVPVTVGLRRKTVLE